jgi:carbonic anhydrase
MDKLVQGVRTFQSLIFRGQRERFERLAERQAPLALFITCADARVNPNLMTQTEPGELFILRNAGNLIPPHGQSAGGEAATIEYALSILRLRHVIVCGHTHCGAMHSLIGSPPDLPAVRAWFAHAEATRRILRERFANLGGGFLVERAVEQNVLVQIDNLRTHPAVAAGLARGDLEVHGWVYRLETGDVLTYDHRDGRFVPLAERGAVAVPCPVPLQVPAP